MYRVLLLFPVFLLLFTSCVSMGRHKRTVAQYEASQDSLQQTLMARNLSIEQYTLDLARTEGANDALLQTQDKLQDRIDALKAEIERQQQRVSNTQQDCNAQLQRTEAEKSTLAGQLASINGLIQQREREAAAIGMRLQDSLRRIADTTLFRIDTRAGQTVLTLYEDLLFSRGSTSSLLNGGKAVLRELARIVLDYPVQNVSVVGHTDNQPSSRISNWHYAALRSVTIVEYLTIGANLGPNRALVVSQGEFQPSRSNATPEGRAANRRIELLIAPRDTDLLRDISRSMQE